ncbi:SRPBCC family protein [Natronoarchaeum sp. GCM10025703]|uniref:SRPBCC family protein n=1 Tax=unclassified Natronoarchaeum TaxID=2620183 RepID=UPI003619D715
MRTIESAIEIDANPEAVWAELTDFESYDEWNPFIRHAEGEAAVGRRLSIRVDPPGGRGATFSPKVTVVDEPRRLAWLGRFGLPHLFDGRHEFRIDTNDDGSVTFRQQESFGGVLVPVLLNEGAVQRGFEEMNSALKRRVEA